jgi:hypothetical protein
MNLPIVVYFSVRKSALKTFLYQKYPSKCHYPLSIIFGCSWMSYSRSKRFNSCQQNFEPQK